MKFLIAAIVVLGTTPSFAMSEEQIGECMINNENNVQTHVGLYQQLIHDLYGDEVEALSDMSDQLLQKLSAASVTTCADVELVLVESYLAGLKLKNSAE